MICKMKIKVKPFLYEQSDGKTKQYIESHELDLSKQELYKKNGR